MEPRETALTGSTRVNSGVKSILSVQMHRKPRTRLDLQEGYWVGGRGLVWMPGKSQKDSGWLKHRHGGQGGSRQPGSTSFKQLVLISSMRVEQFQWAREPRLCPGMQHPAHSGRLSPCLAPSRNGPNRRAILPYLFIKCPNSDLWLACAQPAHELTSFSSI